MFRRAQAVTILPLLALAILLAACGQTTAGTAAVGETGGPSEATVEPAGSEGATSAGPEEAATAGLPPTLELTVVGQRPHDPSAFTQGLEFDGDRLFESRGLYGLSAMTEIDADTGAVLGSTLLDPTFFAEGLTIVGDRAIQITWQEGVALVYDRDTLEEVDQFTYDGEGWGLCDADGVLFMTNGTSTLTHRNADTFESLRTVTVTRDGQPVDRLNEVECADGLVWANVWQTDQIVVIEPATGLVVSTVDASAIATPDGSWRQDPDSADVLNGLAYDPVEDIWLVTGKLWPVMYEVDFEDADAVSRTPAYYGRPTG